MRPLLAFAIVAGCVVVAVAAILAARRRAPEGSHFNDGDRAAGVFGVLATGFALLLGLVIVLAFDSYDQSRSGAETEALLVSQQHETALLLPKEDRAEMSGALVCYARYVVAQEWPRMERGTEGERLNPWSVELFRTIRRIDPQTPAEQAAYAKWLDQRSDLEVARAERLHGSSGVIPVPLWFVLLASGLLIVLFMLLFADSGEPWFIQAILIGSVVLVIVSSLLLIAVLDEPFSRGFGGIRPKAMENALVNLREQRAIDGITRTPPCTAAGLPR